VYALLASFGGFKWLQSTHYKNKAVTQEKTIALQKSAIENWAKAVKELQDEKETLQKIVTEEKLKTKAIEVKQVEVEAELTQLKVKYHDVNKYLTTFVPDRLSQWLCVRYGKGRANNQAKTADRVTPENTKTCAERYTANNLMTFIQAQDRALDQYELKMDLTALYYKQLE
jgi:seryl-tRNA(Sec) selenium transferase